MARLTLPASPLESRLLEVEPGDLAMGEGSFLFKAALLVFVAFLVLFVFRVV
jgi:hypothetical protein